MARSGKLVGWICSMMLALGGCAERGTAPTSDGSVAPADGGGWTPPACGEPERVCPPRSPFPSGACEGASLRCEYSDAIAQCTEGAWAVEPLCDGIGGCAPPLVESCDAPFAGTLAGASVAIGPFGEARAFRENELVDVVWGGQGGAMVRWALHVEAGSGPAPECVQAHVRVQVDGGDAYEVAQPTALHCGDSLATLSILTDNPCESREYAITLGVRVDGIGETEAHLRVMGGLCPRTL